MTNSQAPPQPGEKVTSTPGESEATRQAGPSQPGFARPVGLLLLVGVVGGSVEFNSGLPLSTWELFAGLGVGAAVLFLVVDKLAKRAPWWLAFALAIGPGMAIWITSPEKAFAYLAGLSLAALPRLLFPPAPETAPAPPERAVGWVPSAADGGHTLERDTYLCVDGRSIGELRWSASDHRRAEAVSDSRRWEFRPAGRFKGGEAHDSATGSTVLTTRRQFSLRGAPIEVGDRLFFWRPSMSGRVRKIRDGNGQDVVIFGPRSGASVPIEVPRPELAGEDLLLLLLFGSYVFAIENRAAEVAERAGV